MPNPPSIDDFSNKSAAEMSARYVKNVGYDPLVDSPEMGIEQLRELCTEVACLHACSELNDE